METDLLSNIYWSFVGSVIVLVEFYKRLIRPSAAVWIQNIHPSFITLAIALVLSIVRFYLKKDTDYELLIVSLGMAVLGYDLLIKHIVDNLLLKGRPQ